MIAIDTNILVRLFTRDDEEQFQKSKNLFERHKVFIPDTVILEAEWVLRFAYDFDRSSINEALRKLFGLAQVKLANPQAVASALLWHEQGLDFADAFHLALSQKQPVLKTFDQNFIKKSRKLSNCAVQKP